MKTISTTIGQEIRKGNAFMLPPHPSKCKICAIKHETRQPHDPTTLFYQMYMANVVGREATRAEAMQHCPDDIKELWSKALKEKGIDINSTNVTGRKQDT